MCGVKSQIRILIAAVALLGMTACTTTNATQDEVRPQAAKQPGSSTASNKAVGNSGETNSITDVAGIEVGQVQAKDEGALTGTTVVHTPDGLTTTGVDVRGGAPGTVETDLLDPQNSNPGANAIVLSGGSAYGLASRNGVMRWLEEHEQGVSIGGGVVPIVPGAIIYDLGRGGDFGKRPGARFGYDAIDQAEPGPVAQGTVGAGTGALAGGLKGGVGTASVKLENGTMVGALVVVNAAGSVLGDDCSLLGSAFGLEGEFEGLQAPEKAECDAWKAASGESMNTTIAVVATDANMEKAAAAKFASTAHDGMARAVDPIHSLSDGDSVFAMATGSGGKKLAVNDPESGQPLNQIYAAGTTALTRAITHAMLEAESVGEMKSYCDVFPSACDNLKN